MNTTLLYIIAALALLIVLLAAVCLWQRRAISERDDTIDAMSKTMGDIYGRAGGRGSKS